MRKLVFIVLLINVSMVFADVIPGVSSQMAPPNTQTVVWDKTPIAFTVPVGQERMISFPSAVTFNNTNPALTTRIVSVINNNGVLYIRAKKVFAPIRLYITLHTGQVVLVDLQGVAKGDATPVSVVLEKSPTTPVANIDNGQATGQVALMRYAIQQLYAPMRLVHDNPNIRRTPMYTSKSVRLVRGQAVMALPQISWRSDDSFVTAVLLVNTRHARVRLSPLMLYGNWQAASFYPLTVLAKSGSARDRTTVFLVSDAPFNTALTTTREAV